MCVIEFISVRWYMLWCISSKKNAKNLSLVIIYTINMWINYEVLIKFFNLRRILNLSMCRCNKIGIRFEIESNALTCPVWKVELFYSGLKLNNMLVKGSMYNYYAVSLNFFKATAKILRQKWKTWTEVNFLWRNGPIVLWMVDFFYFLTMLPKCWWLKNVHFTLVTCS